MYEFCIMFDALFKGVHKHVSCIYVNALAHKSTRLIYYFVVIFLETSFYVHRRCQAAMPLKLIYMAGFRSKTVTSCSYGHTINNNYMPVSLRTNIKGACKLFLHFAFVYTRLVNVCLDSLH